jgi:hypothetical protein
MGVADAAEGGEDGSDDPVQVVVPNRWNMVRRLLARGDYQR